MRRDVTPVGERMDPRPLGRETEKRPQMIDVRVDATVRDEPEQMHPPAAVERRPERAAVGEGAVGDRVVDTHEIRVQPPTRPDRQMADLRVAHLTRGQPGSLAGRLERVRIRLPKAIEDRCRRERDRVARPRRPAAAAVEDDERY